MKKKANRILAIDPGTKYLGFAVLESSILIHYGVKTIPRMKSAKALLIEGRNIVLGLISDYRPTVLVVEKTYFANNRNAVLLNNLTAQIRAQGRAGGIATFSIATNTAREAVCSNGAASKEDIAKAMVIRFPELKPYLTSNRKWKEEFHRNMFDAVALAVTVSSFR